MRLPEMEIFYESLRGAGRYEELESLIFTNNPRCSEMIFQLTYNSVLSVAIPFALQLLESTSRHGLVARPQYLDAQYTVH
jgi:hypothetical protein